MIKDFRNLLDLVQRLQKLNRCSQKISVSLVLDESLERIVSSVCKTLNCDRASVFIVDELNNELWSKVGKGLKHTIRIPRDAGIVGYVAITGKRLKIDDAYLDPRFNQRIDRETNYRTKTILTVPIRDQKGNITGVVQAINKYKGIFTADDEGLCVLLAQHAGVMLKNSLQYDKTIVNQTKLLRLNKVRTISLVFHSSSSSFVLFSFSFSNLFLTIY